MEEQQKYTVALTGVAQVVGRHPAEQKVWLPVWAHAWDVGSVQVGVDTRGNNQCFYLTLMFLSLSFSFPSPLSKNK